KPVVALDAVGAVAPSPMEHTRYSGGESWRISCGLVGDDTTGHCSAGSDRPLEESARGNHVLRRRHVSVNDLTMPIDGSIDVVPIAADASVGLVDSPVSTN